MDCSLFAFVKARSLTCDRILRSATSHHSQTTACGSCTTFIFTRASLYVHCARDLWRVPRCIVASSVHFMCDSSFLSYYGFQRKYQIPPLEISGAERDRSLEDLKNLLQQFKNNNEEISGISRKAANTLLKVLATDGNHETISEYRKYYKPLAKQLASILRSEHRAAVSQSA